MREFGLTVALTTAFCSSAAVVARGPRTYETHDFFVLHLDSIASPRDVAQRLDAHHIGSIGELAGHHKFSRPRNATAPLETLIDALKSPTRPYDLVSHLRNAQHDFLDGILWSQGLTPKEPQQKRHEPILLHLNTSQWFEDPDAVQFQQSLVSSLAISDPGFDQQWHLHNTVQLGQDMNVTGLWLEGVTGKGVTIAIIDNGLDISSKDLADNYFSLGSYNFVEGNENPSPSESDQTHGTWCAGEVAAGKNGICGLGIAYDSKVAGIRLLSGRIDESDEAAALTYKFHDNHIYSCSWGPADNGGSMEGPGSLFRRALMTGVQNGRNGKGSIYVFAAGNGGFLGDNCNFDGYTNSIYTITIGAITREGKRAEYSEACAALLAVAYSSAAYQSRGLDAIYTTDVGANACTHAHGGTSAASPLAAGALALALNVRPDLTWRDVQYLLRETAVPVNEGTESDWQDGGNGKRFSHKYGFGKIDTYGLVQRAKTWNLVKPQAWYHSPWLRVCKDIAQGRTGVSSIMSVSPQILQQANLASLEHVTVTVNVNHTRRGDISVELHSPLGMVSYLSTSRTHDGKTAGYHDWTFSSVAHWGESGLGTWTLIVRDTHVNEYSGMFVDWRLSLWGESIDPSIRHEHPLPESYSDGDEVNIGGCAEISDTLPRPDVDQSLASSAVTSSSASTPLSRQGLLWSFGWAARQPWWIWTYGTLLVLAYLGVLAWICVHRVGPRRRNRADYELVTIKECATLDAPVRG